MLDSLDWWLTALEGVNSIFSNDDFYIGTGISFLGSVTSFEDLRLLLEAGFVDYLS